MKARTTHGDTEPAVLGVGTAGRLVEGDILSATDDLEELGRREHREGGLGLLGGILTAGGEEEHDCR